MTKRNFSLKRLTIVLLVLTLHAVWSLPLDGQAVDSVQENEKVEDGKTEDTEEKGFDDEKAIYEFQLTVWPEDNVPGSVPVTYTPQFEDQEVVYPSGIDSTSDVSQGNPIIPTWHNPQAGTKPTPTQSDFITSSFPQPSFDQPIPIEPVGDHDDGDVDHSLVGGLPVVSVEHPPDAQKPHAEVIEQYQVVHPNGTTEYKLVMSNGMANYKKIYNKLMPNGKIVTVQEGYDSVPIPGDDLYSNEFQTQFYIADEHGHNVYKIERHTNNRRPTLPQYLDYKVQKGKF